MVHRNVSMVNSKNLGIPIWMSTSADFRGLEHNVGVSIGVDRVAIMANIICCIIYEKLTS